MFNYNRYDTFIGYEEKKLNKFDLIVTKTDTSGAITYANPTSLAINGYKIRELLGKQHNIIRHPDMPRSVFAYVWEQLLEEKGVYVYVKNLAKDGSFYWVFAYIVPDFDEKGEVIGYHSERRSPNMKAIEEIIPLYAKIKELEIQKDMDAGKQCLIDTAMKKAGSFYNYMFKLQNQE